MKSKIMLIGISLILGLILALVWLNSPPARGSASTLQPAAPIPVCGAIAAPITWTSGNVYVANGCNVWVNPGVTLTIEAGAIVKFGGADLIVNGALLAEGTPAQPITFTSVMTAPAPGDWGNIQINPGATARLSNCDIGYGGSYGAAPALNVASGDVQVHNCRIHDNNQDGVRIHGTDIQPVFENVEVDHNIGYGYLIGDECCTIAGTKPMITGGAVRDNGKTGIFTSWYTFGMRPTIKDLTISGNQGDGIYIANNGQQPWIENVTFTGNTGAAVRMNPDSSPSIRSLTMSGNGVDAVVIEGGTLYGGRTWDIASAPSIQVLGDIYVNPGQFLSLPPGITLKFGPGIAMNVSGSLYAIGAAGQPVKFTGLTETPGAWKQIYVSFQGKAIFQNCDIGYGGMGWSAVPMVYLYADQPVIIQNCRIHHSAQDGIEAIKSTPLIHNNEIYSNTAMGLRKTYGPPAINVSYNWWGDPSGPYNPTLNPDGKGNEVGYGSDVVIFSPWLTTPPGAAEVIGGVILDTAGPNRISPGQTTEFAVHYTNLMTETIENAVLLMQLPRGADYVDSSNRGIYWSGRDQVFWRLGSLPPGAHGSVSVRVRFQWGLPVEYQDGTMTILAGSNYNQTELDVTPYVGHDPILATGQTAISQDEFDAERAANADLQALYAAAIAQGYAYISAYHNTYDNGQSATIAVLVRSDHSAAIFLTRSGDRVVSMTFDRTLFILQDPTSQMTMTLPTGDVGWGGLVNPLLSANQVSASCTSGKCLRNCWGKLASWNFITGKGARVATWLVTFGWSPPAALALVTYEVGSTVVDVLQCKYDCENPSTHCCTGGDTRWGSNAVVRLTNQCLRYDCNATTSTWNSPVPVTCTAFGQRCVAGDGPSGGCKKCNEVNGLLAAARPFACSASSAGGKPSCKDLDNRLAHDPNALYGLDGDLLPGQLVTYTITYENMGEGIAYGVYVTDKLDDSFDFDTVTVYTTTAIVLPASRLLVWSVGELAPKGEIGSTGLLTFTIRLKDGLPSGTAVSNQATVYFPSVPEETPTNAVVNMIQPVAAIPQSVSTLAGQPITITLSGREASGAPLTYTLVDPPLHGALHGIAPNLTYTPAVGFTGSDVFTFKVSNAITHSRAAEVFITINPDPNDVTPPQVLWTTPVSGSVDTPLNSAPIFTGTQGALYAPVIVIGVSEALSATTVTTAIVTLEDENGHSIPAEVTYYGSFNQVLLSPRQALMAGTTYWVRVTRGVEDLIGNPLAADYGFSFRMAGEKPAAIRFVYLPLVLRQR